MKISANIDTEAKTITVNVDGTEISNVSGFSAGRWEDYNDEYRVDVCFDVREEVEGLRKTTMYAASGSLKAKQAEEENKVIAGSKYKDFVKVGEEDPVARDIAKFLRRGV